MLALFIRLRLQETPLFSRLKAEGRSSTSPWRESFGDPKNRRLILLALFGMTAGQAVVWYQGQFQALFFMQNILGVKFSTAYLIVGTAIVLATPFFLFFGRLSDRIGRKPIILGGCLIAALTYYPIYNLMFAAANPVPNPKTDPAHHVDLHQRRPERPAADRARVDPGRLRDDGLRPDRGVPRRVLLGADPLHLAVDPVPHRQRLVRRVPAAHRGEPVRRDRQHLRRADLPDRGGA